MGKETNFSFIRPLFILCNIFGLLPPHSFGDFANPVSSKFKIYALCLVFAVVAISVYSMYGKEKYLYADLNVTVHVTDKLANLVLTISSVVTQISLVFCKSSTVKKLLNSAFELSKQNYVQCFTKISFWVQFVVFNFYMIAILSFDAYVWNTTLGFHIFKFYIGRSFLYYLCNVSVFFMFEAALLIKHLFTSLNKLLEVQLKSLIANNEALRNPYNYDLRRIRKHYNRICDLVDAFNEIYGLPILLVIIFIIAYIINLTDLLLVYALDTKDLQGSHFDTDLFFLCLIWMITLLIFASLLAHSCANAVGQSRNIIVICFTWLDEIPTIPKSPRLQMLKDEILLLIQQTTSRRPYFSAAGFFAVDFTLIGFILGSVTSYIIISVQFMQV